MLAVILCFSVTEITSGCLIMLVSINFLPEIILIDFYWKQVYKFKCVNKIFISSSVWMIPVYTSVECPETEIWG
jgi:hypothetical protein